MRDEFPVYSPDQHPDSSSNGGIVFDSGGAYMGCAITILDTMKGNASRDIERPLIALNDGASFIGSLITNGAFGIQNNKVYGHIYARNLATVYNKMPYINYLISSSLLKQSTDVLFPIVGSTPVKLSYFGCKRDYYAK